MFLYIIDIKIDQEERLMHLNQLADCLLLFKRTMGSIEALQQEDVNLLYFIILFFFQYFFSGSIANGNTKDE
jgi:hypothetical protein